MKNLFKAKVSKPLAILFAVLSVSGLAAGITGFVLAAKSDRDPNSFPSMQIMFIVGFIVFILSAFALYITLLPMMMRKMAHYSAPITKEYMKEAGIPTVDTFSNEKIICPECHTENLPSANFCSKCGKELYKICPDCNTKNDATNEYCNHCGKKL